MRRIVLPEKLDGLAEDHPAALANRRDLRRLNALMRNFAWIRRALRAHEPKASLPAVEWASGDGGLGCYLHAHRTLEDLAGVDRWSRPSTWPAHWPWFQSELEAWTDYARYPVVIGNLILHQFEEPALAQFGQSLAAHARLLIFNETHRSHRAFWFARSLRLIGAHPVTQHDAAVSVRAGFRDEELPTLLGLDPDGWTWTLQTTLLGAYRMIATRREAAA